MSCLKNKNPYSCLMNVFNISFSLDSIQINFFNNILKTLLCKHIKKITIFILKHQNPNIDFTCDDSY